VATAAAAPLLERRFRAMGTDVHLALTGGPVDAALLAAGEDHVHLLEARWSRFLPESEISRLNQRPGIPALVSPETFDLVAHAVAAWARTGGAFDPTVGDALAAFGYDRDFPLVAATVASAPAVCELPRGAGGIELIPEISAVTLPAGATIDPGGIGKGLAADLTARLLVDAGAEGALVNLGGDLRAIGRAPHADGWAITVPDPLDGERELLRLAIPAGAVATSSRLGRCWTTTAGPAHHLIDPRTGAPAVTDVVAVTVVAGEAWWAEALTTALFLAGPDGLAGLEDAQAVIVTADGQRHATRDLEATLR
jgi:thiamine biosynthesis lipoprotein